MDDDLSRAVWHKSTYSNGNGGNCVEVATNLPGVVAVRHSKYPDREPMIFTEAEWQAFLAGVHDHQFELS